MLVTRTNMSSDAETMPVFDLKITQNRTNVKLKKWQTSKYNENTYLQIKNRNKTKKTSFKQNRTYRTRAIKRRSWLCKTLMLHAEAMGTNIFQSCMTPVMGFILHDFSTYDVTFRCATKTTALRNGREFTCLCPAHFTLQIVQILKTKVLAELSACGRLYCWFSLTWSTAMFFNENKRKRLHNNRVKFPEDLVGAPTWPPFLCLGHQHGGRDVMWKPRIIEEKISEQTWEWRLYKTLSEKRKTSPQVSSWEVLLRLPKKTEINFENVFFHWCGC